MKSHWLTSRRTLLSILVAVAACTPQPRDRPSPWKQDPIVLLTGAGVQYAGSATIGWRRFPPNDQSEGTATVRGAPRAVQWLDSGRRIAVLAYLYGPHAPKQHHCKLQILSLKPEPLELFVASFTENADMAADSAARLLAVAEEFSTGTVRLTIIDTETFDTLTSAVCAWSLPWCSTGTMTTVNWVDSEVLLAHPTGHARIFNPDASEFRDSKVAPDWKGVLRTDPRNNTYVTSVWPADEYVGEAQLVIGELGSGATTTIATVDAPVVNCFFSDSGNGVHFVTRYYFKFAEYINEFHYMNLNDGSTFWYSRSTEDLWDTISSGAVGANP